VIPISFSDCFGWLHPAEGDCAVLLCGALGYEGRSVHRPWRLLADRLAAAGFPTMRFDYPGSADACGGDDAAQVETWLQSVRDAAGWLRSTTGVQRLALCGLRFGAALAALAAAEIPDVAALALLAPVISGRVHRRELTAVARMDEASQEPGWHEAAGLRLPLATLDRIARIDLREVRTAPAPHVLILDPVGTTAVADYATRLGSLGVAVRREDFPGYDRFLCDANANEVPELAYRRVTEWLVGVVPLGRVARAPSAALLASLAVLHPPGAIERPFRFGEDRRLFGMLCEPPADREKHGTTDLAVVICNTGGDPHYGIGRLGVTLARRIAQRGVASLRMDFSGAGDSEAEAGARIHLYETDRGPEIAAALDLLQGLGYRRFIVTGICSGGYHALHAAVAESRIGGLVVVNLARLHWRVGDSLELAQRRAMRSTRFYRDRLKQRDVWRRLLRAEVNFRGILLTLARRLTRRFAGAALAPVLPIAERLGLALRHARPGRAFAALARRGVQVAVVLGQEDPGIDELEQYFGASGRDLRAFPTVRVTIVPGLDHMLARHAARQRFIALFLEFLRDRYGVAPPSPAVADQGFRVT